MRPAATVPAPVVPEGDQQRGGDADADPADREKRHRIGEGEQEHRRDEAVQFGEEAGIARVALHVADGVDMDQPADARDDQGEERGERIEAAAAPGR